MQRQTRPSADVQIGTSAPARSRAELDAIDLQRTELRRQFESITERRALLEAQRHDARSPNVAQSIDARIKALDDRSAALDQQMNALDDAVSATLGSGITVGRTQIPGITIVRPRELAAGSNAIAKVMAFQGVTFLILGMMLWRLLRRRGASGPVRLGPEDASRIEQLQRTVDVMAIEVERVSEGQRYVTKLLTDKAIAAGAAVEIGGQRREAQGVRSANTER